MGGTKTEIVVLRQDGENMVREFSQELVVFRKRVPTPQGEGYTGIIKNIVNLVGQAEQECGSINSIGLAHPGTIDPKTDSLINSNTVSLNGKPFKRDLEAQLKRPCKFANDANCFALAESLWGAAADFPTVFGVILGTGVGGAIILNDKIHGGLHGLGGEWGHNVLNPDGELCYCGKRGCVETVISGPALTSYFRSISGAKLPLRDVSSIAFGQNADSTVEIKQAAVETFERLFNECARALSVVINILDPDCIVLGGGVSNTPDLAAEIHHRLQTRIFHTRCDTVILKHKLGDSAGVFGAALKGIDLDR